MPENTSAYKTVIGEAFNIKPAGTVEARNFAVKSFVTGNIVNCTLWDNSHGHVALENGDAVIVNGKIKTSPKKDGDGHWVNLSVGKIGIIPLDGGVRDDRPATDEADTDDPDVM